MKRPASLNLRLWVWLKSLVMRSPFSRKPAVFFLRRRLHESYRKRSDRYAKIVEERELSYDESKITSELRARLAVRGWSPKPRRMGEIHTFAIVSGMNWHESLFPDLQELGPVSRFDYVAQGYRWEELVRAGREGLRQREEINELVLPALKRAHERRPIDWIFCYTSGYEMKAQTLRRVSDELGIPTVNMCLDDKQSWSGRWLGDHSGGQDGIAGAFDLSWTSARVACEWYMAEGGRPLYMPEGFDSRLYRPIQAEQDIPMSFIGEAYGFRIDIIEELRRRGVPIQAFGRGWGSAFLPQEEMIRVINRSRINLGMGGILQSEELTNVKGRDFEIPATGGGVYLTSFNPDLALHFDVGREILCYRNREELIEQARFYLKHSEEAAAIARRARERCLREHRWLHRYQKICRALGILDAEVTAKI